MEITNELIDKICETVGIARVDDVKSVLGIIKALQDVENSRTIGVQYTDDEYGKAARAFPVPQKVYADDAGIDLPIVLPENEREHGKVIWPGERISLHTGIICEWPEGWHGRIIHRSSAEKTFRLRVIEGIIDNYRGELLVQVHNGNSCQVEVQHGQRLGQMILVPTSPFGCEVRTLKPSSRGANGFGHSGA